MAHPEYRTAAQEYDRVDANVLILGVAGSLAFVVLSEQRASFQMVCAHLDSRRASFEFSLPIP